MIGRRTARLAGETLNETARRVAQMAQCRTVTAEESRRVSEAVRAANEVIYQYYAMPRDVREYWARQEAGDGIPVQDSPEE